MAEQIYCDTQPEQATILGENTARRTEFAKEFRRSDGSHLIVLYPDAVHYKKDGRWLNIDNRLTEETDEEGTPVYQNRGGAMGIRLPRRFSPGQPIILTHQGYELRYRLEGDFAAVDGEMRQRQRNLPQANQVDATLHYADVFPGIDLSYTLHANEFKEAIHYKTPPAQAYAFSFLLQAPGLAARLQEDSSLHFVPEDAQEGEPIFILPAPFLIDAEGAVSSHIEVDIEEAGDHAARIRYTPALHWLQDPQRAYPVILDPVVRPSLSINNIQDQQVDSNKNDVSHTSSSIECGRHTTYGIERIYMRYNALPPLTSADVVVAASISIKRTYDSTLTTQVNAHKVKGSWAPSTLQWSNRPAYNTRAEDYQLVKDAGWYTWDVTDIAREWYAEGKNYGMMFKVPDEIENSTASNNKTFCSSDNYVDDRPVLQIAYRNACGLEGYWDYHTHNVGRAGSGHINDFTGNLVFTHHAISHT